VGEKNLLSGAGAAHALVDYQAGAVVSKTLLKTATGSVTVFAFDRGQELSEHSVSHDALALVLDGEAEFRVSGTAHRVPAGELLVLPANEPHSVKATQPFKMLLVILRG
jgi:quercetin dioxygenase-like cupin family protein